MEMTMEINLPLVFRKSHYIGQGTQKNLN